MRTNYCIRTLKIVPVNLCFFWCESASIRNVITFVGTVASRHKNNFVWFLNNIKQFLNKNEVINTEERSNQHRIVDSGVVSLSISDHSLIYCVLKAGVPKATSRTIEYRSFKGFDENAFIQDLKNVPWHIVDDESNVNDAVLTCNKLFTEVADSHAPLKRRLVKGTTAPWMNNKIAEAMRDRNYHLRKAQKSNSTYHWGMYSFVLNGV